jgi:ABC-2 type transport system permease protein
MPLSLADRGVDAYTGVAVWLEAHRQNEFLYRPARDATVLARFGELTAATVLQILLPLLILLLAFTVFAAERESGALRQVASLGVRPRDLVLGKAMGVAAALFLLLVPATGLGVLALLAASAPGAVTASVPRALLMVLGYLLYMGIFLGVALAVSARAPSARFALLALLAFWSLNSLIVPRVVADTARRLYPTPSAFEFAAAVARDVEQGIDGRHPESERARALEQRLLRQYRASRIEELPVNFAGISLQEREEYGNRIFDKHYDQLWDAFERQNRLYQQAALFAPVLAVQALSMGMAGTDFVHHRAFATAAERYRRSMVTMMNLDLARNSRTGDRGYEAGRALWERLPDFQYSAPGVGRIMPRYLWSIALLFLWSIGAACACFGAAARMRVM